MLLSVSLHYKTSIYCKDQIADIECTVQPLCVLGKRTDGFTPKLTTIQIIWNKTKNYCELSNFLLQVTLGNNLSELPLYSKFVWKRGRVC